MSTSQHGFAILIVENHRFFSKALRDALKSHYVFPLISEAATLQKARTKIDSTRFDVMFIDFNLSDGSGLEFTRSLRSAGNHAVICMLTNQDVAEYRDEALVSGADHVFVKGGTDIDEIYAVVDLALVPRFRTMIIADDARYGEQMSALLQRTRPGSVIVTSNDWDEALDVAGVLKPDMVMLRSQANTERKRAFCGQLHACCANPRMKVIVLGEGSSKDTPLSQRDFSVNSLAFLRQRAAVVSSIRSRLDGLSTTMG